MLVANGWRMGGEATQLLVAQGDERINAHGAPRRDVAGQHSHNNKEYRNQREGDRVVGRHVKKKMLDEACRGEKARYANRYAD